ncbi:hypothetical protein G6011_07902 [Alternaria panax]|uniref:J domain-containing protein n=1 Tax=Alternaria panax TaxID=48097 RepID=A0AAD4FAW1_9PLEO|nr:hypothetical protein G6011_07902 [Alternaria panax]
MATPAEEEELREIYYIRFRKEDYTIDKASERSLTYVKRFHNVDMSLATTRYLEEVFKYSISRSQLSSTSSSYKDDLLRHIENLVDSRYRSRNGIHSDVYEMRRGLPSLFGHVREQHEDYSNVPGHCAPEYIPSPHDYRNKAPGPRGKSYGYAHNHDRSDPPRQSTHGTRTHSFRESYYTTEDRQPPSAYESYASDSTYSSHPPVPDNFKSHASSDSHTADSRHSSCPGARPSESYTRPPSRYTSHSTSSSYTDSSRYQTPPSYSHARSSTTRPHLTPRLEGIEPTTDLYTILGVTRNATAAEIKKAHRALSLRWHPDRRTEQDEKKATEKMAEINQANDILCDEVKRRFYDEWGVLPSQS